MRPLVSGLVLAAGGSTRLGQPKQLLPFRGTTLLGWVVAHIAAATALDELIVVLGGAVDDVRRRVDFLAAKVVENPAFGQGCASSYRAGIGAIDPRSEAVAVILGDQPAVDGALIDQVVGAWRVSRHPILLPSYRGRPGHPIVFASPLFPDLVALRGDKAAWKLVDARPASTRLVPIDRPSPADVNTPEDYEALVRSDRLP